MTHVLKQREQPAYKLRRVRLLHTAIWFGMASAVLFLPFSALLGRFHWAFGMTLLILAECLVLALNHGRCPLTDVAARYTTDRSDNFDIYLPVWLARHNKSIFGTLFVVGELIWLCCWIRRTGI